MKPQLETLERASQPEWDRFVESTPGGHLFLTSWWHTTWGCEPEIRVVRDGSGAIVAGVALHRRRRFGHEVFERASLTPYNHPLVDERRLPRPSEQIEIVSALLDEVPAASVVDFVFRYEAPLVTPAYLRKGFDSSLSVTYVIAAADRERWRSRMSESHRRHLRKATERKARDGWSISRGASAADVFDLFEATEAAKRFRLGVSKELFCRAVGILAEGKSGEVWALHDSSRTARAAALVVRDRGHAYYLGGGLRASDRTGSSANYLLFEAIIEDTLDRGLSFDFEGSSLPGVEQFVRGWGGDVRETVRQTKIPSALVYLAWSLRRYWRARKRIRLRR